MSSAPPHVPRLALEAMEASLSVPNRPNRRALEGLGLSPRCPGGAPAARARDDRRPYAALGLSPRYSPSAAAAGSARGTPLPFEAPYLSLRCCPAESAVPRCPKHPQYRTKSYCRTCGSLVCVICILHDHPPPHAVMPLCQAAAAERDRLGLLLDEADGRLRALEATRESLREREAAAEARRAEARRALRDGFARLRRALDRREEELDQALLREGQGDQKRQLIEVQVAIAKVAEVCGAFRSTAPSVFQLQDQKRA